ncbi:hypothetical protein IC762_24715 [Bradyrhizobium genosp. L]|uniref:hypothetical protein n=1 Tax=Bradyrhizobium genosp. L TaxID=83637 RepID=UPI0018A2B864|nr:hypothetical protein [Bradyrhizobium genosp. L]QPF82929.1 hypothetical protein IC762_24715 [Bradyrhizobium genosp. L]
MPIVARHIRAIAALALTACALGGCGTINEKLAGGMADAIPAWAGGLPSDAPPRQGTPEYDAYMKERERKRLMPAAERGDDPAKPAASTSQDAVH